MGGRQRSEYRQENKEIERIDTEIKRLNELGKVKKKAEAGEYKNTETDATLKPLEIEHEKRMLLIKQNREKENKTEAQYILEGTAENLRYYRERIDALQKLEAKTPANKRNYSMKSTSSKQKHRRPFLRKPASRRTPV